MKVLLFGVVCMFAMAGIATAEENGDAIQTLPANETSTDVAVDEDLGKLVEIDLRTYMVGGALGTVFGFGIGHAVQGRYVSDLGWLYTAGEIASLALMGAGFAQASKCKEGRDNHDRCTRRGARKAVAGYLLFTGARIAEIITVWLPRADTHIIVTEEAKPGKLDLLPVFSPQSFGLALVTKL